MSRLLASGNAARNGCLAAFAAQSGFTADVGAFERNFLPSVLGVPCNAEALTEGLGVSSVLSKVSFKPWCAARQTMSATQALREILANGVRAQDATAVEVSIPDPYLKMIDNGVVMGERASFLTSVWYQMALAACEPDACFDAMQNPAAVARPIGDFMEKVRVRADPALLAHFPSQWPARVAVRTREGSRERLVLDVPGDPGRPFCEAEVAEKFRRVVVPLLGERPASELLALALAAAESPDTVPRLLSAVTQSYGRA